MTSHRLDGFIWITIGARRFVCFQAVVYETSKLVVSDPASQPCPWVNSLSSFEHSCIEEEAHVGDFVSTVAKVRMLPTVVAEARELSSGLPLLLIPICFGQDDVRLLG